MEQKRGVLRSNQSGWALTEVMIAVVIVLVILAGALMLGRRAINANKVKTAQTNISTVRSDIQQLFSGQPDYTGLTTAVARNAEVFPETMEKTGGVRNAWNGTVTVSPTAGNPTLFSMTYNSVPQAEAIKLALFGQGSWDSVTLNGTNIPQTGTQVATASGAAVAGRNNTIVYTSD